VQKIIDSHVHLSERKDDALRRFASMNGIAYTLDDLVGSMKKHQVEHGLLLSPPMNDGAPLANEEIIKLCRRSEGLLSPVVTVEPSKKAVAAAIKLADENNKEVKAFKVRLGYVDAAADDPVFSGVYDYAEKMGIPVLFHTGDTATDDGDLMRSNPMNLDRLANKRAELKIVLCHFGNPWFEEVAELIYKHQNVFADMSGLTTGGGLYPQKFAGVLARKLSEAVYFAGGADKILFGTDYPVTKLSDALDLVEGMEIDEAEKRNILRDNAKRVFDL
jgi:uncharacterized protein